MGRNGGRMLFGAHMSIAGGMDQAVLRARMVGCDALQVFTKNNNQWRAAPFRDGEVEAFRRLLAETGIGPVVAHDGYLINLAARMKALWRKSLAAFIVELERCATLGIPYLVTHPGSHGGAGEAEGIRRVAEALDAALAAVAGPMVLLEVTAGQGTSLGWRFEHLAAIRQGVAPPLRRRIGVCLDTCHLFAAGYDFRAPAAYRALRRAMDATLGPGRVRAIHMNDSKKGLGSRVDRHEHIGRGQIGLAGFRHFVRDRTWRGVPLLLETPKEPDFRRTDRRNLAVLRRLAGPR
jgi:deoxyribonuclease IV